jgi:hypothetical protein
MRVDLDNLFWHQASELLSYCLEQGIDLPRTQEIKTIWASPLAMVDDHSSWVLDIPEEHVTWLTLKGII